MDLYDDIYNTGSQSPDTTENRDLGNTKNDDSTVCSDLDLYDDILTEEGEQQMHSYKEICEKFEAAILKIQELEDENKKLKEESEKFSETQKNVKQNISSLLVTARTELSRKEREIDTLRNKLKSSYSRRGGSSVNKYRFNRANKQSSESLTSVDSNFEPMLVSSPVDRSSSRTKNVLEINTSKKSKLVETESELSGFSSPSVNPVSKNRKSVVENAPVSDKTDSDSSERDIKRKYNSYNKLPHKMTDSIENFSKADKVNGHNADSSFDDNSIVSKRNIKDSKSARKKISPKVSKYGRNATHKLMKDDTLSERIQSPRMPTGRREMTLNILKCGVTTSKAKSKHNGESCSESSSSHGESSPEKSNCSRTLFTERAIRNISLPKGVSNIGKEVMTHKLRMDKKKYQENFKPDAEGNIENQTHVDRPREKICDFQIEETETDKYNNYSKSKTAERETENTNQKPMNSNKNVREFLKDGDEVQENRITFDLREKLRLKRQSKIKSESDETVDDNISTESISSKRRLSNDEPCVGIKRKRLESESNENCLKLPLEVDTTVADDELSQHEVKRMKTVGDSLELPSGHRSSADETNSDDIQAIDYLKQSGNKIKYLDTVSFASKKDTVFGRHNRMLEEEKRSKTEIERLKRLMEGISNDVEKSKLVERKNQKDSYEPEVQFCSKNQEDIQLTSVAEMQVYSNCKNELVSEDNLTVVDHSNGKNGSFNQLSELDDISGVTEETVHLNKNMSDIYNVGISQAPTADKVDLQSNNLWESKNFNEINKISLQPSSELVEVSSTVEEKDNFSENELQSNSDFHLGQTGKDSSVSATDNLSLIEADIVTDNGFAVDKTVIDKCASEGECDNPYVSVSDERCMRETEVTRDTLGVGNDAVTINTFDRADAFNQHDKRSDQLSPDEINSMKQKRKRKKSKKHKKERKRNKSKTSDNSSSNSAETTPDKSESEILKEECGFELERNQSSERNCTSEECKKTGQHQQDNCFVAKAQKPSMRVHRGVISETVSSKTSNIIVADELFLSPPRPQKVRKQSVENEREVTLIDNTESTGDENSWKKDISLCKTNSDRSLAESCETSADETDTLEYSCSETTNSEAVAHTSSSGTCSSSFISTSDCSFRSNSPSEEVTSASSSSFTGNSFSTSSESDLVSTSASTVYHKESGEIANKEFSEGKSTDNNTEMKSVCCISEGNEMDTYERDSTVTESKSTVQMSDEENNIAKELIHESHVDVGELVDEEVETHKRENHKHKDFKRRRHYTDGYLNKSKSTVKVMKLNERLIPGGNLLSLNRSGILQCLLNEIADICDKKKQKRVISKKHTRKGTSCKAIYSHIRYSNKSVKDDFAVEIKASSASSENSIAENEKINQMTGLLEPLSFKTGEVDQNDSEEGNHDEHDLEYSNIHYKREKLAASKDEIGSLLDNEVKSSYSCMRKKPVITEESMKHKKLYAKIPKDKTRNALDEVVFESGCEKNDLDRTQNVKIKNDFEVVYEGTDIKLNEQTDLIDSFSRERPSIDMIDKRNKNETKCFENSALYKRNEADIRERGINDLDNLCSNKGNKVCMTESDKGPNKPKEYETEFVNKEPSASKSNVVVTEELVFGSWTGLSVASSQFSKVENENVQSHLNVTISEDLDDQESENSSNTDMPKDTETDFESSSSEGIESSFANSLCLQKGNSSSTKGSEKNDQAVEGHVEKISTFSNPYIVIDEKPVFLESLSTKERLYPSVAHHSLCSGKSSNSVTFSNSTSKAEQQKTFDTESKDVFNGESKVSGQAGQDFTDRSLNYTNFLRRSSGTKICMIKRTSPVKSESGKSSRGTNDNQVPFGNFARRTLTSYYSSPEKQAATPKSLDMSENVFHHVLNRNETSYEQLLKSPSEASDHKKIRDENLHSDTTLKMLPAKDLVKELALESCLLKTSMKQNSQFENVAGQELTCVKSNESSKGDSSKGSSTKGSSNRGRENKHVSTTVEHAETINKNEKRKLQVPTDNIMAAVNTETFENSKSVNSHQSVLNDDQKNTGDPSSICSSRCKISKEMQKEQIADILSPQEYALKTSAENSMNFLEERYKYVSVEKSIPISSLRRSPRKKYNNTNRNEEHNKRVVKGHPEKKESKEQQMEIKRSSKGKTMDPNGKKATFSKKMAEDLLRTPSKSKSISESKESLEDSPAKHTRSATKINAEKSLVVSAKNQSLKSSNEVLKDKYTRSQSAIGEKVQPKVRKDLSYTKDKSAGKTSRHDISKQNQIFQSSISVNLQCNNRQDKTVKEKGKTNVKDSSADTVSILSYGSINQRRNELKRKAKLNNSKVTTVLETENYISATKEVDVRKSQGHTDLHKGTKKASAISSNKPHIPVLKKSTPLKLLTVPKENAETKKRNPSRLIVPDKDNRMIEAKSSRVKVSEFKTNNIIKEKEDILQMKRKVTSPLEASVSATPIHKMKTRKSDKPVSKFCDETKSYTLQKNPIESHNKVDKLIIRPQVNESPAISFSQQLLEIESLMENSSHKGALVQRFSKHSSCMDNKGKKSNLSFSHKRKICTETNRDEPVVTDGFRLVLGRKAIDTGDELKNEEKLHVPSNADMNKKNNHDDNYIESNNISHHKADSCIKNIINYCNEKEGKFITDKKPSESPVDAVDSSLSYSSCSHDHSSPDDRTLNDRTPVSVRGNIYSLAKYGTNKMEKKSPLNSKHYDKCTSRQEHSFIEHASNTTVDDSKNKDSAFVLSKVIYSKETDQGEKQPERHCQIDWDEMSNIEPKNKKLENGDYQPINDSKTSVHHASMKGKKVRYVSGNYVCTDSDANQTFSSRVSSRTSGTLLLDLEDTLDNTDYIDSLLYERSFNSNKSKSDQSVEELPNQIMNENPLSDLNEDLEDGEVVSSDEEQSEMSENSSQKLDKCRIHTEDGDLRKVLSPIKFPVKDGNKKQEYLTHNSIHNTTDSTKISESSKQCNLGIEEKKMHSRCGHENLSRDLSRRKDSHSSPSERHINSGPPNTGQNKAHTSKSKQDSRVSLRGQHFISRAKHRRRSRSHSPKGRHRHLSRSQSRSPRVRHHRSRSSSCERKDYRRYRHRSPGRHQLTNKSTSRKYRSPSPVTPSRAGHRNNSPDVSTRSASNRRHKSRSPDRSPYLFRKTKVHEHVHHTHSDRTCNHKKRQCCLSEEKRHCSSSHKHISESEIDHCVCRSCKHNSVSDLKREHRLKHSPECHSRYDHRHRDSFYKKRKRRSCSYSDSGRSRSRSRSEDKHMNKPKRQRANLSRHYDSMSEENDSSEPDCSLHE